MQNGTVKMFNRERGFGFILPDDRSADMFFHVKGLVDRADEPFLAQGAHVEFEKEVGPDGRDRARTVRVI